MGQSLRNRTTSKAAVAKASATSQGQPIAPPPDSLALATAGGADTATAPFKNMVRVKVLVLAPWRSVKVSGTIVPAVSGEEKVTVTRQRPPAGRACWSQVSDVRVKRDAFVPVMATPTTVSVSVVATAALLVWRLRSDWPTAAQLKKRGADRRRAAADRRQP